MKLDLELSKKFYYQMLLIRRFEEKCEEVYSNQKIRGFLHLYIGEEAVGVGVMSALSKDDAIVATYREHGLALARGISANSIMAELYGKMEGTSGGRGGSMHLYDVSKRFYGGNAIVAAGLPFAVGMALADKMANKNRITVCFFGDGAVAEGEFHESLNLAALWNLPVLFICENNLYGMGTALKYAESETNISKKAASYKMTSHQVDGMDVIEVAKQTAKAVKNIHMGKGPQFLECLTYRFRAHSMFDAELYRDKEEVQKYKDKGPLITLKKNLQVQGLYEQINIDEIEQQVNTIINEAVEFAENAAFDTVENLEKFVYSPKVMS